MVRKANLNDLVNRSRRALEQRETILDRELMSIERKMDKLKHRFKTRTKEYKVLEARKDLVREELSKTYRAKTYGVYSRYET